MTGPSWRGCLLTWRHDRDRQEMRTRILEAVLPPPRASGDGEPGPGRGRLSALRGPLSWLSDRPAMQTAAGHIVARPERLSWGRDGAWLCYPMCRVGRGHWAVEEWLPSRGWVRLPSGLVVWPRMRHAVLPGMHPMWRRCGVEDLIPLVAAVRHLRAALVHWRPVEAELRAARITAADLVPLLECPDPGVRQGALQALAWAADVHASDSREEW